MRLFLSDYYDYIDKFEIADILDDALHSYASVRTAAVDFQKIQNTVKKHGDYALFGLQEGASKEAIKSAYRAFVRKYHPDVHEGDKNAHEAVIFATNIYEYLYKHAPSDPNFTPNGHQVPDYELKPEEPIREKPVKRDPRQREERQDGQRQDRQRQHTQEPPYGPQHHTEPPNYDSNFESPQGENTDEETQRQRQQWDEEIRKWQEWRRRQQWENDVYRHISESEILGFINETLTPAATKRMRIHMRNCANCRKKFEQFRNQHRQRQQQRPNHQEWERQKRQRTRNPFQRAYDFVKDTFSDENDNE